MRRNTLIALVAAPVVLSLLAACGAATDERTAPVAQATGAAQAADDVDVLDLSALSPGTTAEIDTVTIENPQLATTIDPATVPAHVEMLDDLFQRAWFKIEQLPTEKGVKDRYAGSMTKDANADHNKQVAKGGFGFGLGLNKDAQTTYDWRVKDYTIAVTGPFRLDGSGNSPGLRAEVTWRYESIQPADTSTNESAGPSATSSPTTGPKYQRMKYSWKVDVGTVVDKAGKPVLGWWNWQPPHEELTDVTVK